MKNIFVAVVNENHSRNIECYNDYSKRVKNGYTIIKLKFVRDNYHESGDMLIRPMDLMYKAEMIYDISNQQFYKNRYDVSGGNEATNLPKETKPLFETIIDVSKLKPIDELKLNYTKSNLIEAIYLTGKLSNYIKDIDPIYYELIRYRYGKKVNPNFLENLITEHPEYLI